MHVCYRSSACLFASRCVLEYGNSVAYLSSLLAATKRPFLSILPMRDPPVRGGFLGNTLLDEEDDDFFVDDEPNSSDFRPPPVALARLLLRADEHTEELLLDMDNKA